MILFHQFTRRIVLFTLFAGLLGTGVLVWNSRRGGAAAHAGGAARFSRDSSLDNLLGNNRRERHAAALAQKVYAGKTYSWKQYAAWGEELLKTGRVTSPPVGPAPSRRISEVYRCVHCHNLKREDPQLTHQDPDAREKYLRKLKQPDPEKRDGATVSMTPATTLWGAVDRETFYNGHYAEYHRLRIADGQAMNPKILPDAVEVCSRYCSCGRFPAVWELDSLLTALWERQLRLRDLNLPAQKEKQVLAALNGNDAGAIAQARQLLRRSYLRAAGDKVDEMPVRSRGTIDLYADNSIVRGNAKSGLFLYKSACAGCHGAGVHPAKGPALIESFKKYHRLVRHGTERDKLYMPLFTAERLSRKQLVDIRVYLMSLR